ncbi:MAG: phosphocholine cytidylyltransferase family protein [Bradymonadaceae bacterium]|nr:phosphocholine cytidylyltransferase family protein [Lujinxingiaceae bacterium]
MKAIIIAAGMGSRLQHHTEERPKCMVEVAGRSILDHQLDAFRQNGVTDIHIIRGYLAERLVVAGATYHANLDYRSNNILFSLFCAQAAMEGPFLTTYSDIVFTPEVVQAALNSAHDISLVVDRQWAGAYDGRSDHPVSEAELAEVEGDRVIAVGKQVGPQRAAGEFIGLARFSELGGRQLKDAFADVRARLGDDDPFHAAKLFRKAYLTDLFLELIKRQIPIGWTPIDGQWREIDTVEDLERVNANW